MRSLPRSLPAAVWLACAALATCAGAQDPAQRAAALLARMSNADMVGLMHGVPSAGYTGATAANAALGIPALTLNDGRQGFRANDGARGETAFPCQLAVVATFDVALMQQFGAAMGAEFSSKGANVVLAPMLILARVPLDGRTFESIGEDPELAHAMAFAHVTGVQSVPGVIANADDFVLNNQELDRGSITAICDERTLFEMYYRGYKGAIDAGVGSFMCSYNRVIVDASGQPTTVSAQSGVVGTYACENADTLGDLQNPAGLNFSAFTLSDWGGTHSTIPAILAGLNMEMPGDAYFGAALLAAVESGALAQPVLNASALRILTTMFARGVFDAAPCPTCTPDANVSSAAHTALAREIGAAGTVLLTNPRGVLPIAPAVRSIIVIGDDGDASPDCCGAGSGGLSPAYIVSPFAGIAARAGPGVSVTYLPSPAAATALTQFYSPIRGDHFLDFVCVECPPDYTALGVEGYASASPCAGCLELGLFWNVVNQSNLVAGADFAPPPGYVYVRPLAWALPLNGSGGGAATATLELWRGLDTPAGAPPRSHSDYWTLATAASRAAAAAAGYSKLADIALVYTAAQPADLAAVAAAAAAADLAVVCAATPSSEGSDRTTLALAPADDALIAAVVAAQPATVVALNQPGAVLMPWAGGAGAILASWYAGQEMGHVLADVLFGDVNPSGRLPLTFPASDADTPMRRPQQYPGVNGSVVYEERLLIGYRWWDAAGVAPAFAFGHGLSYTSFAYSDLAIRAAAGGAVAVSCTVTNTGARAGKEVVQLYLNFPEAAGEPPRVLRGFTALPLAAGASAPAAFTLTPRDMSIWSVEAYAWAPVPGVFTASVGASSRDLRLNGTFTR